MDADEATQISADQIQVDSRMYPRLSAWLHPRPSALKSLSLKRNVLAITLAQARAETDVAPRPVRQLGAVDVELLQRPVPAPDASIHVVHHQQVLHLLDFRETETLRRVDGGLD